VPQNIFSYLHVLHIYDPTELTAAYNFCGLIAIVMMEIKGSRGGYYFAESVYFEGFLPSLFPMI
jgi:hypothetical protein